MSADRELAHEFLFKHRHPNETPPFHREILRLWGSNTHNVLIKAFRGAAKTTKSEEYLLIEAMLRRFHYALIVSNTYSKACAILDAIKHELLHNETLLTIFGNPIGQVWNENSIELPWGIKIEAIGRGQSPRGLKYHEFRPDLLFGDDIEDEESIASEESLEKCYKWFLSSLLPALAPDARVRLTGTPLHPKALVQKLEKDNHWLARTFPIVLPTTTDPEQWKESLWPDRFPIDRVKIIREQYADAGRLTYFAQEYLCIAEDPITKPFSARHIQINAASDFLGWMPVYVAVDPARTTRKATSSRTGYAAWSWMGSKLYVHDGFGEFHQPDQIVNTIFRLWDQYHPIVIGVERDGLEEFILQPLRMEMARRCITLPIEPLRAPRHMDKDSFIRGLQPFYEAGDIIQLKHMSDLENELLEYPSGRKDVLNALAYSLRMRGGKPVYEGFTPRHVDPNLDHLPVLRTYLVLQATSGATAGVLFQMPFGGISIVKDWYFDLPPIEAVELITREIGRINPTVIIPQNHFDRYSPTGLASACHRFKLRPTGFTLPSPGGPLRGWFERFKQGQPLFRVSREARWVINALSGGYAYDVNSTGALGTEPKQNQYRLVSEALELGIQAFGSTKEFVEEQDNSVWIAAGGGRRYRSALPTKPRRPLLDEKLGAINLD